MSRWYSSIYKACVLASLVAFVIGGLSQKETSIGAYIAGYSVLTLGVMMVLIVMFNKALELPSNSAILYSIVMSSGPFLCIFGIISFVLYLLITYYKKISAGLVAPGYNSFSNIINMLLMMQIYLVYTNISGTSFDTTGKLTRVTSAIMYLLSVLTIICALTLYIILKYYTTDGFAVR